ncbi:MAG: histidine kinase dimerization/phospho-acceptor domain-containing protein, partial [Phycisphaerae bacterium]
MKTPIWFRLLIVINLLVIAATLVIGYGSSEIAGRVVEARLVEQTARRTGGFLESQDLPFSDTLMQYLRHLHGAHFITTDPAGRQVAGSSLTDGDRWLPAGGLDPSGTIEINGRAHRYESILIPAEPPNRPDAVRLYALIQRSEFELPRRQVAERIYRVMWVVIVAASAVSIGLAWTIARPIHRLSRRMKTLTERPRHAGGSAGSTGHHRGPKEVVQLGQAFDKLMDRLAETRKELARQEQLATLGRVSACVAHELRNPLSGIRMNLHVLREELAQRGIADESVDTGLREIERMSVYLDELMELSAGTADDQQTTAAYPTQQKEVEAQALVDSVVDLFRGKLQ